MWLTCSSLWLQRSVMVTNITQVLIPYYQQNRAVVGLPDGGLANPMPLLFDPTLGQKPVDHNLGNFAYPALTNITRPKNDTDVAYMTVRVTQIMQCGMFDRNSRHQQQHLTQSCFSTQPHGMLTAVTLNVCMAVH